MADAGNALLEILTDDAAVAAIVSTRIYRYRLQQQEESNDQMPAIVFTLPSGVAQKDHAPQSTNFENHYIIDCYSEDGDVVADLAAAVKDAIDGKKGTFAGVNVLGLLYDNERDLDDGEPEMFRRQVEVTMFIQE